MTGFPIGSFEARQPLGQGGMGEVWAGIHTPSSTPVAIKLVTAENLQGESFERAFEAEVRAVASLDHPGIIRLYDVGRVPADQAARSSGRVEEGTPYLVMELADGGNLRTVPPPREWAPVRAVLLAILDALAHAHARGVIHRDIKPANVLWGPSLEPGGAPRVILSDFGIAHAGDGGAGGGPTWGTPAYMSPERFTLEWRDLGPWTDLYSLGCLAFTLLRGEPPFRGATLAQAMQAHLYRPVPPLRAREAVPPGIDAWLRAALAKAPGDRFQSAADAAHALRQLQDPVEAQLSLLPTSQDSDDTVETGRSREPLAVRGRALPEGVAAPELPESFTVGTAEITWTDDTFDPAAMSRSTRRKRRSRGPRRVRHPVPPMPPDWREAAPHHLRQDMPGGGLRLFGLRVVRMVDRDDERDALWRALAQVHRRKRPTGVLLQGHVGTGKTRLAMWLCERAVETGAALALRADHGPGAGVPALARTIAAHLRCQGLGRRTLRGRVEAWLQSHDVREDWFTRELVAAASLGAGIDLPEEDLPRDLRATVRRFVQVLAEDRPVVLHLDDVPWGPTSLSFAAELLEQSPRLPILLVMTARDQALDENPVAAATFDSLASTGLLEELVVGELPVAYRVQLVQELCGFEEELARRVADRTGGNPLFTVAVVRDWVARGMLVEHPDGLRLAGDAPLALPDDLHGVWHARLDSLMAALSADARPALELAAALGESVDGEEWEAAAAEAGLRIPPELHERLDEERLITGSARSWRWVHGIVRESVVRDGQEAGRMAGAHDACARMLLARHPIPSPLEQERIGRHLAESGDHAAALPFLEEGVHGRLSQGDPAAALGLLGRVDAVLRRLGPDERALERVRARILRAKALAELGQEADAAEEARAATMAASAADTTDRERDWQLLRAHCLLVQGQLATVSGQLNDGRRLLEDARRLLGVDASFQDLGLCLRLTGRLQRALGELDAAEEAYAEAAELYGAMQRDADWADCLVGLAEVATDRHDPDHATGLLTSAVERYRAIRHRRGEGDCLRVGGEAARLRGDLDTAEHRYRRAQAVYQRVGSTRTVDCRLGRARVALERGDLDEADRLVRAVTGALASRISLRARAAAVALAVAAHRQDWASFDMAFTDLGRLVLQSGLRLAEVHDLVSVAARAAATANEAGRAARVRGMLG